MNQNNEKTQELQENKDKKPVDEVSGFYFSSSVKIFDPNTDEILVQKRGDI
jgi:GTPase SAR1 family protein